MTINVLKLDSAHDPDDPDDLGLGQTAHYTGADRAALLAAVERDSPGRARRLDAGQRAPWNPNDRELALAAVAASGLDPKTYRPVAGSMPLALRSDAYVCAFALARERRGERPRPSGRTDDGRRLDSAAWPPGYDRDRALAALAAAGVTASAHGVPMSSVSDAMILGALSVLLARQPTDAPTDAPTDEDRSRAARELQRSDGLRDAPTDAERERRIEKRARRIARDRAYSAEVAAANSKRR